MLPIIIGVLGVLGGLGLALSGDKKEIYVSVLGPIGAGKTTLHNYFRKTKYKNATIGHNNLGKVVIEKDEKKIVISRGKDISGSEQAVKSYYKDEIIKSNYIFFIFDSQKILVDDSYSLNTNARLNFINKKNSKKTIKAKVILVASHFDKVKAKSKSRGYIWGKIEKIANEGKIEKPIFIDLTDKEQLDSLKNKLFQNE